mgnify:CR=1 FL=1
MFGFLGRGAHDYFKLNDPEDPIYRGTTPVAESGYLTDRLGEEEVRGLRLVGERNELAAALPPAEVGAAVDLELVGGEVGRAGRERRLEVPPERLLAGVGEADSQAVARFMVNHLVPRCVAAAPADRSDEALPRR